MKVRQFQVPGLSVRADFAPNSINVEKRTVDVVWGTSTQVRTYDWEIGAFMEELSFDPGHVRMDRLNNGAPVLDNHNRYAGSKGVLGVVENPKLDGNGGTAQLRFSKRSDVEPVWQDVQDGILKGISVGYRVYKYQLMTPGSDTSLPVYRAIDWEPHEISIAPVQADVNSSVRSADTDLHTVEVITPEQTQTQTQSRTMENNNPNAGGPGASPAPGATPEQVEAQKRAAAETERTRVKEITNLCRQAQMENAFIDEQIDKGATVEQVRALVLDKFIKADKGVDGNNRNVTVAADETDKFRSAVTDAICIRGASDAVKSMSTDRKATASSFRSMRLMDLVRECLRRDNQPIGYDSDEKLIQRAITSSTSDFPVILGGVVHQTLLAAYATTSDKWNQFCSVGSVSDFREHKRLRLGSIANLDKVGENEEFRTKSLSDATKEGVIAESYGNLINISRKMIINDDLGAFLQLTSQLGRAAARTIESTVFAVLAENNGLGPVMSDGKTLFHADHKNIQSSTPGAPAVAQFEKMRQLMAKQMEPGSKDYLDLMPSIGLFPLGIGSDARVLNGSQYDPDETGKFQKPNKVYGLLANIVDTARLSGTRYYMFADPGIAPCMEVSFLNGNQTPRMEQEMGFEVDGIRWKIAHDFGVGAVDWRSAVTNAGA